MKLPIVLLLKVVLFLCHVQVELLSFFVSEMRNSEKVILENDGDDDALDVIMQGLYLQPFT